MARDASQTRQLLLEAARARFGKDGYTATTVREIAADAGVNVALISRYFESKEGLFEACVARVGEELNRPDVAATTREDLLESIVRQIVGYSSGPRSVQLLLLLHSSGDARADEIRSRILRSFAERIAAIAGWHPGLAGGDDLLLRAEIIMSAALGMIHLRSSAELQPLSSASESDLRRALRELLSALLGSGLE